MDKSEYTANRALRKNAPLRAWRVTCGTFRRMYFTSYHAEQCARGLRLHAPLAGMPVTIDEVTVPNDPLTRLTVGA